jgi:hypothetical protein
MSCGAFNDDDEIGSPSLYNKKYLTSILSNKSPSIP